MMFQNHNAMSRSIDTTSDVDSMRKSTMYETAKFSEFKKTEAQKKRLNMNSIYFDDLKTGSVELLMAKDSDGRVSRNDIIRKTMPSKLPFINGKPNDKIKTLLASSSNLHLFMASEKESTKGQPSR